MRNVMLLALGLMFVAWPHDSARGQTTVTPPVSLAPPASPPGASATHSRVPPATSGREASTPVIGGFPTTPNAAADYDGFSVGTLDDNDTPKQVAPPVRARTAKGSKPNLGTSGVTGQSSVDEEDDALKRKLTICRNCK
ncbi:hypothetical protein EAV90_07195 [Bradyrhizobium vignae]|uniref:Uncharacterized protein n=3 Tax=Nitrobacteraceae TaxID=41294 RepID=A0A2U3Q530_9BRAD|nr:hypothetical protein [Bradyrhizobium vignae]MBP0109905.1 hypothetical protein [Bradyrhizobium vignae]RXH05308.1 hypothetical protein EAV90_07195 [Bradyrhizobium vignae]SPP96534.1 conserved exported protein of unknown function [Bradyrhizobium vignae]